MLKSLKKSVRLSLSDSNSYEKKEKKEPTKSASFSLRNLELTVKYMGYLPVSDARSLQTLKQAIRFVVQQRIRRTHSRFEMRNFQVIIYDLESEDTILDIPIQKVALCGKEFVKGFEKCFAVNVTTDDSHVCHVMQAATTYEAEKFLVKIAEAFEALGKMAKKSKQRKSTIPTQAAPTSKSTPASDEMARSDNGSQQRSRYSSNFLNVDNPNTLSTGISRDSHDGLSNSMETRQLPPIPKNFNYDNAEVSQSHHANESHGLQIRPLPPVPDVARNSSGHDDEDVANRETPYASLKNTVKKDEVEDPYSTIKNKLGEENPYSTVKNKRVDENPYSSVKNKSNEENPYSTVKDKLNEEDPYSSIKDIRKAKLKLALSQPGQQNITTQGTPQYQTEDEEDPYSTVRTKTNSDNSKSDVVIQVRSPAGNLEVSAHANDSTRGNPAKQVDEQTDENKSGAVMAEFKASITPDLYEARKSYQSRRSIANQWTSYNVSEVFEEVGGDEQNDVKSNKKFYDPTDIYVNLHKYRMQNQNKSSSSRQYNDVTNKIDDKGDSEKVHQQSATKTNDSQVDGNLSVNQHKFYQSIKDVQSTYQKLKSKIKSNLVKQHNQQPTQLDTREAVRRVVSEIYKYDYRLDNSEKLKEIIDETSISVDSIDPETGYSLLHHSVSSESLSSINFFLERGANVNVQNRDKRTPLHVGVTTGNFSIVKRLLCHGADVTIKDTHGRTALHLVMGLQLDRKMMLLLVEYGARISEADSSSTRPVDIEPELRVIQREMILKCNDELCTIDVGAIFRIRSRVNSKSSVGSGTGSIKSIESRSNFSITNEEVRLKLGGIEENSNDNPDNLLAVPNKQQSDMPGSDEENVNYDIEFGDGSDKLTNFPNVLDAALHDSFDDQSEILSDESNTLKDFLRNEFIKATNEITESSMTVNKETTNVKLAPANTELQASHQSGGDSRRQITKENSSFSDNNKDDLVPVYKGENLMSDDNINDNEFSSDLDAWGGVFSEMDAWDDVFVEENSNLSCNRQGNNDLPDTSSLKLSIGHSFDQKPLSREDIIKNKISNVELIQTLKIENSYLEGPNNKAVLPDDPAELEDFDSKEIFGQEEKAAKNLRSLAILSKNPECHTIILSLLFAPNSILQKNNPKSSPRTLSVQLTALAHTESSVKSLPRYLASFIFTLCKSDGINSQKKSINSGIVNLLSDLLDSKADLIKKISLSLIWELLHIDSDREFCTVLSHFHVDPMLDLVAQCEAEQDMRADEFDPNAIDDMYRQYVLNSHNLKDNEIISMASKVLARTSIYFKIRRSLSQAKAIALLCTTHALLPPTESYLLGCTVANIAMDADNHAVLEEYNISYALRPLLSSKDPFMQYHAARCLVYMGYYDLHIYLFSQDYDEMLGDVIYANDNQSEHDYIRGTTLERIVEILTGNSSVLWGGSSLTRNSSGDLRENSDEKHSTVLASEQILEFILTMFSTFVSAEILMNLLLHRFRHPSASRIFGWKIKSSSSPIDSENPMEMYSPLPLVHVYLMRVWEMWLENFSDDFVTNYGLAISLSKLIPSMRLAGGPYRPAAARLEELLGKIKTRKLSDSNLEGTGSFEAIHNKLYEQCKFDIIGGTQPCSIEEAAKLASIQLYIEDITGVIEENHDNNYSLHFLKPKKQILINNPDQDLVVSRASSSRIKYCLPNVFAKSKLATKMVKELHEDLCLDNPSERNAKHSYIDYCQSLTTYGCCVFNLEEVIVVANSKHKRPKAEYEKRLLCIHPKHVIMIDAKTKEKISYNSFQTLKRWEPGHFGHVVTMQLTFTNKAHTFLLEDEQQWQELDQLFWACIEELDWQRISKMSKTPWSKLAEETQTWGRAAAAAHARTITVQAAARLSSSTATEEDLENYHSVAELKAKTVSHGGSLSSLGSGSVTLRRSSTAKQSSNGSSYSSGKDVDERLRSVPMRRRSHQNNEGRGSPMKPPSDTPKWRMRQVWALSQPPAIKKQVSRDSVNSDASLDESWVYVERRSSSSGESTQTPATGTSLLDDQSNTWYRRNHPSSPDSRSKRNQTVRTSPRLAQRDRHQSNTIPREDSNTSLNLSLAENKNTNDDYRKSSFVTSSPTDSFIDVSTIVDEAYANDTSKGRSISRASTSSSIAESLTTNETKKLPRNSTFGSLESELGYSNSYKSTESSLSRRDMVKPAGVKSIESYGIVVDFPKCPCPPDPDLPELDLESITNIDLLRYPRELAKQITLIDHHLFRQVTVSECHKKFSSVSKKKRHFDENNPIQGFAERFNKLSQWVTASVLMEKDIEVRAHILCQFILTAKHCLQFANYNAVMAIVVAGLGSSPIRRLEKTKALISKEILAEYDNMEILMDPKSNYKEYRDAIKTAPTPAVPYFGIYLKDLTFATDGNPDYLRGGLINLTKRRYMYVVLEEMKRFQKEKYFFQSIPEIQDFICDVKKYTEEELYKMSIDLE